MKDKLGDASTLAQRLGSFHLLVDNAVTVANLQAAPGPGGSNGGEKWSVFVMVDCGYHRDGVDPSDPVRTTVLPCRAVLLSPFFKKKPLLQIFHADVCSVQTLLLLQC